MFSIQKQLEIEENLLLDAIFHRHGYDFRNYARASISRRLKEQADKANVKHLSELIPIIIHDEDYFCQFLMDLSVNVTEMFRDPHYFLSFKKIVIPSLTTYPFFKVWHAGCSTGEEVYSMGIMLKESNLLNRANIYATDINPRSLHAAKEGIYPLDELKKYDENYKNASGKYNLSKYYQAQYSFGKMSSELTKNTLFTEHSLSSDSVFGEMNVIICRNVMIYFNKKLQKRAIKLFYDSLCHGGYLCLGDKESLDFLDAMDLFQIVDRKAKIYQKKAYIL